MIGLAETVEPGFRRGRLRLVMPLVAAVIAVWMFVLMRGWGNRQRAEWLAAEVASAGGNVAMPRLSLVGLGQQFLHGNFKQPDDVSVFLKDPALRDGWMLAHGNLADLKVKGVYLRGTRKFDAEDFGLMTDNPVELVDAVLARNVDRIAESLSQSQTLRSFRVPGSDLSDGGLSLLPLERLEVLEVQNSTVTARGLQELRRCEHLESLAIDGTQLDAELAATLKSLPALSWLTLVGRKVTDEELKIVSGMRVEQLYLDRTSVTSEGVEQFRTSNSGVEVIGD